MSDTVDLVQRSRRFLAAIRRFLSAVVKFLAVVVAIIVVAFAAFRWRFEQWPIDVGKLDELTVGMSKDEVRAVIGSPEYDSGSQWTYAQALSWPTVHVYFDDEGGYLRSDREQAVTPYAVRHAGDVVGLVSEFLRDDPRERFVAVYLDSLHKTIAVHDAHVGTCDSSPVHPREVFGPAVALSATAVIVAQNTPSGDPTPSPEDRCVTERLRKAGDLLGVPVLDHLVIGDGRYCSFAEEAFRSMPGGAS